MGRHSSDLRRAVDGVDDSGGQLQTVATCNLASQQCQKSILSQDGSGDRLWKVVASLPFAEQRRPHRQTTATTAITHSRRETSEVMRAFVFGRIYYDYMVDEEDQDRFLLEPIGTREQTLMLHNLWRRLDGD